MSAIDELLAMSAEYQSHSHPLHKHAAAEMRRLGKEINDMLQEEGAMNSAHQEDRTKTIAQIAQELGEPIELDRLDWRPQYYNNKDKSKATRANVSFYLPIEAVVETLDNVCGPHGWQSHLSPIGNGPAMICSLSIYAPDHNAWITKSDAGFIATTQNDGEATTIKGSASDALKRAAQLWGVGRFIKKFPDIWVAWDPSKKQATEDPIHALRTKLGTGKIVKYDDLVAAIRAKGWSKEWVFETLGGAVQDYMGKNGGSYQDIFSVLSAAAER